MEDKATICRAIRQMQPVFEAVLPERAMRTVFALAHKESNRRKKPLEERLGYRINNLEDFLHEYPEFSMVSPLIVPFPGGQQMSRTDVGGKATSLIRMCEAGLPVPSGAVITSAFFTPWFDKVKASATWTELINVSPDDWAPLCSELKELIEAGKVTPVIDRTYPLSEAPEAIRYLEEGHARGKVVITV